MRNIHSILSGAIDAAQLVNPAESAKPPTSSRQTILATGNRNLRPPDCDDITMIKFTDMPAARMEAGDLESAILLAHWVSHGWVWCGRR